MWLDLRKATFDAQLRNNNFEVFYLEKENRCLHEIHHDSIAIYALSKHQL